MRTAVNSFFIIFFIMGLVFSCETEEVRPSDPNSFFEIDGKKTDLSQAFMDVTEISNGNFLFDVYMIGNGLSYNLTDGIFEESGDIVQLSLVLPQSLIPSGTSSFSFDEWSNDPQPNTFVFSSIRTNCESSESCDGLIYQNMVEGSIEVIKVQNDYEVEFTLMFENKIIEGKYQGFISRRAN